MMRMKSEINGQPIEIATGPPLFQACANVVKHPAKIEIIENEIAKLENELQVRFNSCLYPSSARRRSSSFITLINKPFLLAGRGAPRVISKYLSTLIQRSLEEASREKIAQCAD